MKKLGMALMGLIAAVPGAAQVHIPISPDRGAAVIAHRACWQSGAPEVSASAIRACEAIAPDLIEVDVRSTRDGALFMMHDATVDRTTNGTGASADMTLEQIRALRLRARDGGPDAPVTDERVPTLEEALEAAGKGRSILHLHLYTGDERGVAAAVKKAGMTGRVTTWVSGDPDDPALANSPLRGTVAMIPIVKECPALPTRGCWQASARSLGDFAPLRPAGFYIIPSGAVSTATARRFYRGVAAGPRPSGSRIMASTLFDLDTLPLPALEAEWRKLIGQGVDMIMTDRPSELLAFLRAEKEGSRPAK